MLREVRASATEGAHTSSGLVDLQAVLHTETQPVTPAPANPPQHMAAGAQAMEYFASQVGLDPEHWLPIFVEAIISQLRVSGGITFEVAERLLQQRKDDFLRDFLVARRMYRTYPQLFPEIRGEIGPLPGQTISQ